MSVIGVYDRDVDGRKPDTVRRYVGSSGCPGCRRQTVSLQGDIEQTVRRTLQGDFDFLFCHPLTRNVSDFFGFLKLILNYLKLKHALHKLNWLIRFSLRF